MPAPAVVAAGIQGIGNVVGGLIGNAGRKKEAKRQRKWQEKMWHMQNEYNTPKAQMQRFEEAGLNKNLMYGQGNEGNAEKIGQYQQPEIQNIPWGDAIGQYYNVKLQQKQLDNVDAQTQNLRQEKLNKVLDGMLKIAQGDKTRNEALTAKAQAMYSQEAFRLQNDNAAMDIKKKIAEIDLNSKQSQKAISEIKLNNQDYELMQKLGISKSSPIIMKNVKYLSEVTGLTPTQIVAAVGGVIGLKAILDMFPIGKIGKSIKKFKP